MKIYMTFNIECQKKNEIKKNIKEQQTPQEYTPKQQKLIKIINALQNGNIDLDFIEDYTGGIESFIEKL